MPELPEVEVVRRGLQPYLAGRTLVDIEVRHPRAIRRQIGGAPAFTGQLRDRKVQCVSRRGKYLWCVLDDGQALISHLGMSGQLLLVRPGEADDRHLRIRFDIGAKRELWFVDQRTFGGLFIDERIADDRDGHVPAAIAHIARDPLDPFFDDDRFLRDLRARHTGIKRALLDQSLISGIGNIYADEALWRARLHFDRPCNRLSAAHGRALLSHTRDVMEVALSHGGTSFDALYVNVNGESGYFERSLDAYGREGESCHRCGRLIVREAFMNRSAFRCPLCQRRPATSESLPRVRSPRR